MKSIRRQMAYSVGGIAVIVVLGGVALYLSLRLALKSQFDEGLKTKAEALVTASEIEDEDLEIDIDVQAFAGFGSSGPGDYFEIRTQEGLTVERSPSLASSHLPDLEVFLTKPEGFADLTLPEGVEGRAYWRTFTPAKDLENRFPDLRIVVASDRTSLRRTLRLVAIMIASIGTGGVVVIVVLLHLLMRAGIRPLDSLSADVQAIDVNRLARRVSTGDLPMELQGVAGKLNELLGRLEVSFSRERRFSSQAAHELRTPLAELKSMMEFGASWPEELTPAYVVEMLEVVSELEVLIEKLSLLARAESGGSAALERIDLAGSLSESLARHVVAVAERELQIELEVEPGEFHSDPVIWHAIVNNLVDNAVAYAPEGGVVTVSASPRFLAVANAAPNLVPEDLDRLFERFWRKSPARSAEKHSGLGLSIVRSGAEFLGGTCRAALEEGRLRIVVEWNGRGGAGGAGGLEEGGERRVLATAKPLPADPC